MNQGQRASGYISVTCDDTCRKIVLAACFLKAKWSHPHSTGRHGHLGFTLFLELSLDCCSPEPLYCCLNSTVPTFSSTALSRVMLHSLRSQILENGDWPWVTNQPAYGTYTTHACTISLFRRLDCIPHIFLWGTADRGLEPLLSMASWVVDTNSESWKPWTYLSLRSNLVRLWRFQFNFLPTGLSPFSKHLQTSIVQPHLV